MGDTAHQANSASLGEECKSPAVVQQISEELCRLEFRLSEMLRDQNRHLLKEMSSMLTSAVPGVASTLTTGSTRKRIPQNLTRCPTAGSEVGSKPTASSASPIATPSSPFPSEDVGDIRQYYSKPAAGGPFRDLVTKSIGEAEYISKFDFLLESFGVGAPTRWVSDHVPATPNIRYIRFMRNIVASHYFDMLIGCAIISNAIVVAIDADLNLEHSIRNYNLRLDGQPEASHEITWSLYTERIFAVFFTLELLLRVGAFGIGFLIGEEWRWNLFDTVLMVFSHLSAWVNVGANLSFGRLLRLLRLAKAARTVRVLRYFQYTRIMLHSVANAMVPLCWSFIFVLIVMFLFATWMMTACADFVERQENITTEVVSNMEVINTFFPSFHMTMLTLFMVISGGRDWWDIAQVPIQDPEEVVWSAGFVLYMALMVFGLMNIVVGLFVTATSDMSKLDHETVMVAETDKRITSIRHLKALFKDIDLDRSGQLTWEEFEIKLDNEEVRHRLAALDINVTKARALFKLLDVNENEMVSLDEFVMGCLRLRGHAKTLDVGTLMYECRNLKSLLHKEARATNRRLQDIANLISAQSPVCSPDMAKESWKPTFELATSNTTSANGMRSVRTAL